VSKRIDPYVSNQLRALWQSGIAKHVSGVYEIVIAVVGMFGLLLVWTARFAMRNRSITRYLTRKGQLPPAQLPGPVFVTRALHPHRRSDLQLPEWRPIDTPSEVQDRTEEP
jgi:hypothetical protein